MHRFLVLGTVLAWTIAAVDAQAMTQRVEPESIHRAIEKRWSEIAPPGATLEVRAVPALTYDGTQYLVDVLLPEDPSRPGPRALPVTCRVDGRTVSRGLANVLIRAERVVWTARRALRRGEEIRPDDLIGEPRVYERQPTRLFHYDAAETWRVVRDIEPGTPISPRDLETVPDIEAGEEILLVARAGRSTVSVPGRARQSGNIGETVLVHNPLTGALVRAVVLDGGSAELVTPHRGKGEEG